MSALKLCSVLHGRNSNEITWDETTMHSASTFLNAHSPPLPPPRCSTRTTSAAARNGPFQPRTHQHNQTQVQKFPESTLASSQATTMMDLNNDSSFDTDNENGVVAQITV
eukprot:15362907-Ditylum_brightwellii.AAC.1